jgi:uncharacterized protein
LFDYSPYLLASLGVLLIGISKAGFGGGLGVLTTPLCALAFQKLGKPPAFALGFVLPLLIAGDSFSLWRFWKKWDSANLRYLLPGVVVGVLASVQLIDRFSPRQLNVAIGVFAMAFVTFQLVKEKVFAAEGTFAPNHKVGQPIGVLAGVTSTFANAAGPVIAMFLLPQQLSKSVFVATNILVFFWINWIKAFVFLPKKIITAETLMAGLPYLPLIPVGVLLGIWLNNKIPERHFRTLVYTFTFLTGLKLALS